ncbi:carbohydrate ABC transporter substrate-binding protein [Paenarthrobacter sp. CM16]|uniref:ABC transporter substrate-binding protein n=1 Tax=Paenarthrobacter sp. CM16 TaxID=2738447 RepID=UPI00155360A6|nr:ABC transporter substrate-binding protein [Paenarthrobacter sp. CM16]NQD89521.1 carbohydrate ABC transporter substrate-binding protein [Paenarthrobacter sp. CM16]
MSLKTPQRIAVGAVAALLGISLSACSGQTPAAPASEKATTGSFSIGTNHSPAVKTIVELFNKKYPDIKVDVRDMAQSYREVLGSQLAGGNAPDVVEIPGGGGNPISAKVAGQRNFYADLGKTEWAGSIPDIAKQQLETDKGKLVAVPMVVSSIGGIYNQNALDEVGLSAPKTWSEVLDFCGDAKAKGRVAYGLGLSDTWTTQLIPYALTSTLVYGPNQNFLEDQTSGKASFADSAWKDSMDKYLEMDKAGCFNASPVGTPYATVQDAIRSGNTLGTVSVASETANIAKGGPANLKLTYTAFPANDKAEDQYLPLSTSGFALNAKSSSNGAAATFIDFLAEPATQVAFGAAFGDAPAMPGEEKLTSEIALLAKEYLDKDHGTTWPDRLWPNATIQPKLFDGVQGMFIGSASVPDVLDKMDAAFKNAG